MEKIIEGNKKIALFSSYKRNITPDDYKAIGRSKHWCIEPFGWFDDEGLKYHESWDWLLPTWVKWWDEANKLAFNNPNLYERVRDVRIIIMACIDTGDISNAQRILADAITWYNQQSPSK